MLNSCISHFSSPSINPAFPSGRESIYNCSAVEISPERRTDPPIIVHLALIIGTSVRGREQRENLRKMKMKSAESRCREREREQEEEKKTEAPAVRHFVANSS